MSLNWGDFTVANGNTSHVYFREFMTLVSLFGSMETKSLAEFCLQVNIQIFTA